MKTIHALTASAIALALLTGTTGIATAQDSMEPAQPGAAAPAAGFPQEQLEAFAVAYLQVNEIGMSYDEQMQAAQTDEDRMVLEAQAQQEMMAAVEEVEGVTVEDYNQILITAQGNPELGAELQGYVDALVE